MIVERTLTTARGTCRVLDAGAGWPVLLIHAFPLSAEMWRPQLEAVPQGWRYVAPDLRGFGRSPAGQQPPTVDEYAADLESVLDALEIETAVIGGLSMGGYVTFALHRRAPDRFTSLVLADTKAEADTPEGRDARRTMSALVRARGVGAEDVITPPADSERMVRATERSQLVVVPGAGHLSNLEAPAAFSTALANF